MDIHPTAIAAPPATARTKLRVGLIGFGKTGRAVAAILLQSPDIELTWIARRSTSMEQRTAAEYLGIDAADPGVILSTQGMPAHVLLAQAPVDAIVDFSAPDGIDYYGDEAARRGIAIVTAISNYPEEQLHQLARLARSTRVIHSPNITLGINFLLIAAKILRNIAPDTDIEIVEEHFKSKPEVSGTARIIARHLDVDIDGIKSIRAGGIIGTHEIIFGFPYQNVRLKHESIAREAFGNGIVFALTHLPGKKQGLFSMEDLLVPFFRLDGRPDDDLQPRKKPWWKIW